MRTSAKQKLVVKSQHRPRVEFHKMKVSIRSSYQLHVWAIWSLNLKMQFSFLLCSGVCGFLSSQFSAAFSVPPSSHVACFEVMSDVVCLRWLSSPGVHKRLKKALQWSKSHLLAMPRRKWCVGRLGCRRGNLLSCKSKTSHQTRITPFVKVWSQGF